MADYYVDSATGSDGDNGTTQALAWATIQYAVQSGGLSAGDYVWVRRNHTEIPAASVVPAYVGTTSSPITVLGWPRPSILNTTITEATWTNGSTTVDLIVGITVSRVKHQGRFATAPDGSKYLITRVVDTNTIIIDREYAGATVSSTTGKFAIDEDEDYADRPTDIDGWDSDDHTLANIDFNSTAYYLYPNAVNYLRFLNIELKDSTGPFGQAYIRSNIAITFQGCLFKQNSNNEVLYNSSFLFMKRCILEGSGTGTAQRGLWTQDSQACLEDVAIYNCGDEGIHARGSVSAKRVNIGVEQANGDNDLNLTDILGGLANFIGREVNLGGTNGYVTFDNPNHHTTAKIEDYDKVLGKHKVFWAGGTWSNVDVGDTNAPSAASSAGTTSDLIEILPNTSGFEWIEEWAMPVFVHEFEADTTSKTYTYYLQNNMGVTLNDVTAKDDIWLKIEYVDSHDDTTEYTKTEAFSSEIDILARASDTDWDSLSVTAQPAVASKVRITCYISKYVASGGIYIDPKAVVS